MKRALSKAEPGISSSPVQKAQLRTIIQSRIARLPLGYKTTAGEAAARHCSLIPNWNLFHSVLLFESMNDELDTRPVMEAARGAGKPVFVPRVEGNNLGFYAALRPAGEFPSAAPLEPEHFPALVVTPGIAFDRRLNRLGRGRGYYDRFFAGLDAAGLRYTALGLCMDIQLIDEVPVEAWDKPMDMIVTESGLLRG